jgi:magnesium-transporting ATPase (P-type)
MGRHIIWVSILLTIITLIGYIYGYTSHNMDPFSPTLGLDTLDRDAVIRVIGEREAEIVPANWNDMTPAERTDLLLREENESSTHEGSSGILGAAEHLPRTMAFMVLALGQIFHVMAIHSGDKVSFFRTGFSNNRILLGAVISTFLLQLGVVYVPFLQTLLQTSPLAFNELALTFGLASIAATPLMNTGKSPRNLFLRRGTACRALIQITRPE